MLAVPPHESAGITAVVIDHAEILRHVSQVSPRLTTGRTGTLRHRVYPLSCWKSRFYTTQQAGGNLELRCFRQVRPVGGPPIVAPRAVEGESVRNGLFDLDDRFPTLSADHVGPEVRPVGFFILQLKLRADDTGS